MTLPTPLDLDGMEAVAKSPTWPYVFAFALEMEKKLAANRHKGDREGWSGDHPRDLFDRLMEEARELKATFRLGSSAQPEDVRVEAADVANFAMMIADVEGGLKPSEVVLALIERVRAAEARQRELVDAVIWMSGSDDFAPNGKAHTGWIRVREGVLAKALKETP